MNRIQYALMKQAEQEAQKDKEAFDLMNDSDKNYQMGLGEL
jgi:hypothetical protein